ncbi:MAG: hypothetical protein JWQ60_1373 [Pseudonocardia sp.]|nr:hypothetical protein [Pseudonocardia sp.]
MIDRPLPAAMVTVGDRPMNSGRRPAGWAVSFPGPLALVEQSRAVVLGEWFRCVSRPCAVSRTPRDLAFMVNSTHFWFDHEFDQNFVELTIAGRSPDAPPLERRRCPHRRPAGVPSPGSPSAAWSAPTAWSGSGPVSPPAGSARLLGQPACWVSPPAGSARLLGQPACWVSPQPWSARRAWSARLPGQLRRRTPCRRKADRTARDEHDDQEAEAPHQLLSNPPKTGDVATTP